MSNIKNVKIFTTTITDKTMDLKSFYQDYKEEIFEEIETSDNKTKLKAIKQKFLENRINVGKIYGFDGRKIIIPKDYGKNYIPGSHFIADKKIYSKKEDLMELKITGDIVLLKKDNPGIVIAYPVSDDPVLIIEDKENGICALTHCNIDKISQRLPEKTISVLQKEAKSSVNNLKVYIGPHLKKEHNLLLINELNSMYEEFKIKVKTRNDYESTISDKNKRLAEISYRIKYLTDYIEQGGGASQNVKKVLSNPKLSGIHNTISNLIETEDDYLIAVTVALGGAKDYVVVDNPNNAKTAINYLKENNLGRVTFFPLSVIKPRMIDEETLTVLKREKGFIDTIDNIVTYDEKYQNIIQNQLGNVILVDTLDDANNIRDLINNRYKIVTLSGEVINVGGSITGGKIKTNSIISEKYELQKLSSEKEKLEEELIELKTALSEQLEKEKKYQSSIFEVEKQKVVLTEEKETKQVQYQTVNENYQAVQTELNSLEGLAKNTIKDEEEKVLNKYYEVMAKKEEVEKQSKLELSQKEKIENIIDELEATFRVENTKLRELENNLKDYEINNSKASVKMDNLLNILSETYQMTFEKAKSNYILEIEESVARKNVNEYRKVLKNLGTVNTMAIEEYDRISTRYEFLKKQISDLEEANTTLLEIIDELDEVMKAEFLRSFKQIQIEFDKVFKELFGGGEARLELTDKEDLLGTGVNIIVTPPGKKLSSINLLSGGEKTLTAISLLFAILNIKKIPFCLFDEVEAALDEANVDRVGSYLGNYKGSTQLIIITHKKKTMEYANTLYGITMQESGVSKLVSVKLNI